MDAEVIVIGAGAAGLSAARDLAGKSLRVIVLEARDRIGGRVHAAASNRTGALAELGAEFIHGQAPETMALLAEAGMTALSTGGESWTSSEDGRIRRDERDLAAAARILEGARKRPADESVGRFLQRLAGDPARQETLGAARLFVEGFDAADPAIASAYAIADELRSGVDFASARPLGGYQQMFEHLRGVCDAAGVPIHLSTVARRIAWSRGAVSIETEARGDKTSRLNARAAVVTIPIGVLRQGGAERGVTFQPGLPAGKRAALQHLEMGHVVRVALWFRTPFWERTLGGRYRDAGFFRSPGGPFGAYWTQLPVRSQLVIAWAGGPRAVALSRLSREEIVERALDGFGGLVGDPMLARAEFDEAAMHDWGNDRFSRGAYSYVLVGGENARSALGTPVDGTLFFAGEATSTDGQGGTVNGALETGRRAAAEVAARLGAVA